MTAMMGLMRLTGAVLNALAALLLFAMIAIDAANALRAAPPIAGRALPALPFAPGAGDLPGF